MLIVVGTVSVVAELTPLVVEATALPLTSWTKPLPSCKLIIMSTAARFALVSVQDTVWFAAAVRQIVLPSLAPGVTVTLVIFG